jgi:hypothetical protein
VGTARQQMIRHDKSEFPEHESAVIAAVDVARISVPLRQVTPET